MERQGGLPCLVVGPGRLGTLLKISVLPWGPGLGREAGGRGGGGGLGGGPGCFFCFGKDCTSGLRYPDSGGQMYFFRAQSTREPHEPVKITPIFPTVQRCNDLKVE